MKAPEPRGWDRGRTPNNKDRLKKTVVLMEVLRGTPVKTLPADVGFMALSHVELGYWSVTGGGERGGAGKMDSGNVLHFGFN